jgi:WD40 repeat protein
LHLTGFSPDGRSLVTAASDGTARVWDVSTGLPLTPLLHQAEPIGAASFSPDSNRLATVSKGGTVHLWDLHAEPRPVEHLLRLTKLLSGQQMHAASGSFVAYVGGDLRLSWSKMRADFPEEFGAE